MDDVGDLLEQREKLKSQLLADSYNIFVDRLLNWIGRSSQKLSRSKRQPSFVYSAFLFSLFALLLDILVSLVFNDFRFSFRRDFIPVELLITGGIFAILVSLRT